MILSLFELRCDDCNVRWKDMQFTAITTAEARSAAKKHGWARYRVAHGELMDFCPQCKGKH